MDTTRTGLTVILDIGKTHAKLSLWTADRTVLARETRANARLDTGDYVALDPDGIEQWVAEVLPGFGAFGRISAIVPVAHGAALAVLRDGTLACPPVDYDQPVPAAITADYRRERDSFADTGSPALPDALNAGVHLAWLEALHPDLLRGDATVVTWPQYWAWRLSGVAATEVTSLGCHSDLWRPVAGEFSHLAHRRGWAEHLAPVRHAADVLGPVSAEWVAQAGLPADARIYCGLHDSNAALLAARGFPEFKAGESTVLSTGTWFVAMRSPGRGSGFAQETLPEARDCLVNVDICGRPVPSARFMGGREIDLLTGSHAQRVDNRPDQPALLAAVPALVSTGAMVLPTFAAEVGPFPAGHGRWIDMPEDDSARRAAVCLYAALVADASLDLIGAGERILVEGRFAAAQVFVRALAALRPRDRVFVLTGEHDVSHGALRLVDQSGPPLSTLARVEPLETDLTCYAARWRRETARIEIAA